VHEKKYYFSHQASFFVISTGFGIDRSNLPPIFGFKDNTQKLYLTKENESEIRRFITDMAGADKPTQQKFVQAAVRRTSALIDAKR
jgi:hypothetical protein